jgi:hypothetical protein
MPMTEASPSPRPANLVVKNGSKTLARDLARVLSERIDARIRTAEPASLQALQAAPTAVRVRDGIARVLMPYL